MSTFTIDGGSAFSYSRMSSPSLWSVLRAHPLFARLWCGALVSSLGDTLTWLALTWYVLDLTGRGGLVGALLLCFALPAVVAGPMWGHALDRFQPRTWMLLDNLARAGLIGLVPLLAALGLLKLWMLFAVAVLVGALAPATQIGVRLFIPVLVSDRELEQANAAHGLAFQLSTILGPAIAGAVVAAWGAPRALVLDALSFVFMAWTLLALPSLPRTGKPRSVERTPRRLTGWPPSVLATLGLSALFFFAYGPLEVALPVFTRETLGTDAAGYGALWSALGVGSVLGTLLVGPLARLGRTNMLLAVIMALWGVAVVALALTSQWALALGVMFVGGVVWGPYTALETTLLQRAVDSSEHGRLFGVRAMLLGPASPLGTALGGALLLGLSAPRVIALSGLACVLGALVTWPWIRRATRQAAPAADPAESAA